VDARALSTRRTIIALVHSRARATVEAATISGEHASPREALGRLGVDVDRAELEAGVVAVYPVLDGEDKESTATRAAVTQPVVTHDHETWDAVTWRGFDESDRAEVEGIIRRAFPMLNGDDEESLAAVAVVAEAVAIGVLAGVRLDRQPVEKG
jgi:hypothetical protein